MKIVKTDYTLMLYQIHVEQSMEIVKCGAIVLIGLYLWAQIIDWCVRSVSKNENRTISSENRTIPHE